MGLLYDLLFWIDNYLFSKRCKICGMIEYRGECPYRTTERHRVHKYE